MELIIYFDLIMNSNKINNLIRLTYKFNKISNLFRFNHKLQTDLRIISN